MKDYFIVFIFFVSHFIGFSQCIITNQPLSSQVVCQNGATTPLEVINEPPSQCTSVCAGQGVTTFQWFANTTSDTLGSQIISGADSNVYIPPSNIIGQKYFFCRIYVDGCLWNFSDIVSVLIVGLPNPNLSDAVMCSGQQPFWGAYSDQIIFDPMADTVGTFSYSWIVPASMGDPGNVNQILCDFEGLYVVNVIDINGCVGVDSAFVTVLPASISDISITNNSGNIFPCEGDTINLTAAIYNGFDYTNVADGTTVVWTTPFNQPNPGNVVSFNTTIPGNYKVQVLDLNGCWSSTYIPQDVSFSPMPTLSLNSVTICQGNSVTLTAQTSISGGDFSWDDGSTYYGSSASIIVSPTTTTTFLVYYTTSDYCTSSASATVTINPMSLATDYITSCAPITWIDGNVYSSDNNTANFNIVGGSANGCDSLVTLNLIVNPTVTPVFTQVGPYCSGAIIPSLPTNSSNGITGTWSPAFNNTATTTYTFTPTAGQCAISATMTITINPATVPTFTQVGPYLSGASIPELPTTSTNGISGTWSPAINNTATTTYTFTPAAEQCSTTTTMTITINEPLQYTLTASDNSVCAGTTVTLSVSVNDQSATSSSCGAPNVHNPNLTYGTMVDQEGNTYKTIVIGSQEWMAENLKTSIYSNGDPIPNVINANVWGVLNTGAWVHYNNDSQYECPYGKLYNWYAVSDLRNVCPNGWHVPSVVEWSNLIIYIDPNANVGNDINTAGGKMKSTGLQYWNSPNLEASNESGFSGLAGGQRSNYGVDFYYLGDWGLWWSSTIVDEVDMINSAWGCDLNNNYMQYYGGYASKNRYDKGNGLSVRCIKD